MAGLLWVLLLKNANEFGNPDTSKGSSPILRNQTEWGCQGSLGLHVEQGEGHGAEQASDRLLGLEWPRRLAVTKWHRLLLPDTSGSAPRLLRVHLSSGV